MAAYKPLDIATAEPVDTAFVLAMKYRQPYITLEVVIRDFLTHLELGPAKRRANAGTLPFPAFKMDGSKSAFMVSVADLAAYLDAQRAEALRDWRAGR
jgi:hypothetical protein